MTNFYFPQNLLQCKTMKNLKLQNVIWKEGKYYVALCLNVDVSSFGKTKEEAIKNLNEALELYFEDTKLSSFTPIEKPTLVSQKFSHA